MKKPVYIYPTDTVFGIGCCIYEKDAVENVHRIKQSAKTKPLSVLASSYEALFLSFDLPKSMTKKWLHSYFSYGSSLGLPLSWAREELPSWITCDSHFVVLRVLSYKFLNEMKSKKGLFVSTSLNKTGEDPIFEQKKAIRLYQEIENYDCNFVFTGEVIPSGKSSSIILLDESLRSTFIRRGKHDEELQKHLELLTT